MIRRALLLIAALALIAAAMGFAAGPASAQQDPGQPPPCPVGETCAEPPSCPPDATVCVDPIPCPDGETCVEPPRPCLPDAGICIDPIPCSPEEPCPGEVDSDGDGYLDSEEAWIGSDPNNAASTPEHAYYPETCTDGVDNDTDGAADMADPGCNIDSDADGLADPVDNCAYDPNPDQADADGDGIGNLCDFDADNDTWDDYTEDRAGSDPNNAASTPEHTVIEGTCGDGVDNDADGATDAADPGCAPDGDYDFVPDTADNCPTIWNDDQLDDDGNGVGNACQDSDGDGYFDFDELAWGTNPNDPNSVPEFIGFSTCSDGIDNDGDGAIDGADPGCDEFIFLPASAERSDTVGDNANAEVKPIALPAAGAGAGSDSTGSSAVLVALVAAAATAGAGLVLVGRRLARRNISH